MASVTLITFEAYLPAVVEAGTDHGWQTWSLMVSAIEGFHKDLGLIPKLVVCIGSPLAVEKWRLYNSNAHPK